MIETIRQAVLTKSKLILSSTEFLASSDSVEHTVKIPAITLEDYKIRHVVVAGSFTVQFLDSSESEDSGGPGAVWPYKDYVATRFKIIANQANSIYYCVVPGAGSSVVQNNQDLEANQSTTIAQKRVAFVFGSNFLVNGVAKTGFWVVACENSSAVITSIDPCKILIFKSSLVD